MDNARPRAKIIVTLGPATNTEEALRQFKARGVDFVRLNMSHSSLAELARAMTLAKKVGIPFIVDTEGSQVRTGRLARPHIEYPTGARVDLYAEPVSGDETRISLTPGGVVGQLSEGDVLYCGFDSLILRVIDAAAYASSGYVSARVLAPGALGSNKGVYIDSASGRRIALSTLTPKDHAAIALGLAEGVEHVAASFMRSGAAVEEVRRASGGRMKIISKIECVDGLAHLDEIIDASDFLLIDRGDLSREIFLDRVPFTQKIIVHRARRKGKPTIVATNFLESMIEHRVPTRAEIHDIESSITDGAAGLTLAAETAIGAHPFACVAAMQNVMRHVESAIDVSRYAAKEEALVEYLESQRYMLDLSKHSPLLEPNGGLLVNRFVPERLAQLEVDALPSVFLNETQEMDAEQIALGAYSPLDGFMTSAELESVLARMRLPSGAIWPLPIVLAVSEAEAAPLMEGSEILLRDRFGAPLAALHLTEKYPLDRATFCSKLYGTTDRAHPGVRAVEGMGGVLLAGPIDLLRRRASDTAAYDLTPAQTRRLFRSMGWNRVVGFHTRNVIHRSHEFIQMEALARASADGLFVHPVVGKKKAGDFASAYIVKSYELMLEKFYPPSRVAFATFASYSRYAGPREALFTALVRQNFGCSHFVVGRDHTGVGDFYSPKASHDLFDEFPDLGIEPILFDEVRYVPRHKTYGEVRPRQPEAEYAISGTEARALLARGTAPPEWFMRPEIAACIIEAVTRGERVFF